MRSGARTANGGSSTVTPTSHRRTLDSRATEVNGLASPPLDVEGPGAAEADDRHELEGLVRRRRSAGQRGGQLLQHDPGLEAGQRGAEAEVRAGAERQVVLGVGPADVEAVGSGKTSGSRLAAPMETSTLASAGSSTPLSSTGWWSAAASG